MRLAGTASMRSASTVSKLMLRFFAVDTTLERKRSVSKIPGSMKLMVTLEAATERATPARNAVSPARAPDDRSSPNSGIFTEPEVMLTMRPNFLATIGSIAFWISSTATIMLAMTPSIIFSRSRSRKSRNGGPALLFTRMSGSGQAANSAFWPSGEATSAATAMILAPVALRSSAAVASSCSLLRPLMTTSQPASASRWAQPRPRPLLDAQTMALRPAIPRSMPSHPTNPNATSARAACICSLNSTVPSQPGCARALPAERVLYRARADRRAGGVFRHHRRHCRLWHRRADAAHTRADARRRACGADHRHFSDVHQFGAHGRVLPRAELAPGDHRSGRRGADLRARRLALHAAYWSRRGHGHRHDLDRDRAAAPHSQAARPSSRRTG